MAGQSTNGSGGHMPYAGDKPPAAAPKTQPSLRADDSAGFIVPNPLISRGKPAFASTGLASAVNDGGYKSTPAWDAGLPSPALPAWVAIQVGVGPRRVLLSWTASANYNYTDVAYGAPAGYRIESSADSKNGLDGSWRVEALVRGNAVRTRAHSFEFDGRSWVRLTVTDAPTPSQGISIDEIDVHDASDGCDDTWLFLGDGVTAFAFDRDTPSSQPSFAEHIHARYPGYFPLMINAGIGGEVTSAATQRLPFVLAQNPDVRHFAIGYGSNDAWNDQLGALEFRANLQALVEALLAAGRVPVLARIPFSPDDNHYRVQAYNQVVDQLTEQHGLLRGPDLYAWFREHPEQLSDEVHPAPEGRVAINRLWAEAMDSLYVPQ